MFSFDGRSKEKEKQDLVHERADLIRENHTRKPKFSSPIENAIVRKANWLRIREIEKRLDELAIA